MQNSWGLVKRKLEPFNRQFAFPDVSVTRLTTYGSLQVGNCSRPKSKKREKKTLDDNLIFQWRYDDEPSSWLSDFLP